jgi:hypothetical protein
MSSVIWVGGLRGVELLLVFAGFDKLPSFRPRANSNLGRALNCAENVSENFTS